MSNNANHCGTIGAATNKNLFWVVFNESKNDDYDFHSLIQVYRDYDDAVGYYAHEVDFESDRDESLLGDHWDNRYIFTGNQPNGEKWWGMYSPDCNRYSYINLVPVEALEDNWLVHVCEKIRFNRVGRCLIPEGSVVKKGYGYMRKHHYSRIADSILVRIPCNGVFDDDYFFSVEQLAHADSAEWEPTHPENLVELLCDNSQTIPGKNIELPLRGELFYCDFPDEESSIEVIAQFMARLPCVLDKLGISVRFFIDTKDSSFYFCTDAEFDVVATVAELIGNELWKPYEVLNT